MALLVDTTVWIDLFRGSETPQVKLLEQLMAEQEGICTCGPVLAEVLQGVREDEEWRRIISRFDAFLFLPMAKGTFVEAAELYRLLRRRGITARKPVDCMIAAVCIEHGVPLLHNDRDFDPLETYCGLQVLR